MALKLIRGDLSLGADFGVGPTFLGVEEHENAHLVGGHVELESWTGGVWIEGFDVS